MSAHYVDTSNVNFISAEKIIVVRRKIITKLSVEQSKRMCVELYN